MMLNYMSLKQIDDVQSFNIYGNEYKVYHLNIGIYNNQDAVKLSTVSEKKICDEIYFNVKLRFLKH